MSRIGWLLTACVCVVGLAAGFGLRPLLFPRAQIALYPGVVELKQGHIEGEPLEVHFELVNESRHAVTVNAISTSCGCMAPAGKDGPLRVPFTLPAGARVPIALGIGTAGRVGPQDFSLYLQAEGPRQRSLETHAEVRVDLLGTLRASQRMLVFHDVAPGTSMSAEIELADMLPDPGTRIRDVRTSNSQRLQVEIDRASGSSTIFGASVAASARATLKIHYTPDVTDGRIQEMITVVPEDSRYGVLQIPLYCEMAEPPLRLRPRGLTLSDAGNHLFRRTVVVESQQPVASVEVVLCPQGIHVNSAESADGQHMFTIEGDTSSFADDHEEIQFLVDGQALRLPIRILP